MANGRGGVRAGAGRPKKPLAEKILEGNRSKVPHSRLEFPENNEELIGEIMPDPNEFLKQNTKNTNDNLAPKIYEETWKWLKERECDRFVKKELIEQYALNIARWIQCEEGINQFGLLAKHPTTGVPIASPYVSMGMNFMKQANNIWLQIFQIVKENCTFAVNGKTPNDDIMEQLLNTNPRRGN